MTPEPEPELELELEPERTGRVAPADLALFASVYAIQGVVVAYFFNFNKNYMTASGLRPEVVGAVETVVLMPMVFKFLVGPLSDRVNPLGLGHRKPYILLGLLLQMVGLVGLATLDPGGRLAAFGAMAFLTVTGLALYDTCCDGMVVDITPHGDRPRVQAALMVARFVATTVCTFGFGRWLDRPGVGQGGVPGILWACAALSLVPTTLALRRPDSLPRNGSEGFEWSALGTLAHPWTLLLLVYGAWYAMVGIGAEITLSAYYQSLGFGPGDVGTFGAVRYAGRAVGALLLPVAARRVHQRELLTLGLFALILTTAGQAAIAGRGPAAVVAFLFGAANGWNDALFCVLAMEGADPRMAASTYALIMAVSNLSVAGAYVFAQLQVTLGGFRSAYGVAAAALLPLLALTIPLGRPGPDGGPKAAHRLEKRDGAA